MELKTYLQIIDRRKKLIIGIFLVLMILIIALGLLLPKKYEAVTSIRVIPPKIGGTNYVDFNLYYASILMNTYSSLVSSTIVENALKEQLNLTEIPKMEAEVVADSELIRISVLHSDPVTAAKITNAVAEILINQEDDASGEATVAAEKVFSDRLEKVTGEMETLQANYEALWIPYAQNNATIEALSNQIDNDQSLYNTLKDRYEVNLQLASPDTTKLLSLSNQLLSLERQISTNLDLLDEMKMQAAKDSIDIEFASAKVAQKEREYDSLISQYDQMQTIEAFQETNQLMIVDRAVPDSKAASPNLVWLYGFGVVVSLFSAALIAFFVDNLDDTVHSIDEVEAIAQVPLLGAIAREEHKHETLKLNGEFQENVDMQRLQMNLSRLSKEKVLNTLVLSDIELKNGKVPLSAKIAAQYARADVNTILIDANTRNPSLHHHFKKLTNEEGLSHVLRGKTPLEKVIKNSGMPNLFVLPAGDAQENPGLSLGSEKMKDIIHELQKTFKMVVIDIAPLLYVSDSDELLTYVDGVLLVVENDRSHTGDISSAVQRLEELKAPLIGCVVNHAETDYKQRMYERQMAKKAK